MTGEGDKRYSKERPEERRGGAVVLSMPKKFKGPDPKVQKRRLERNLEKGRRTRGGGQTVGGSGKATTTVCCSPNQISGKA